MLDCPACRNELTPHVLSPVQVHACDGGCGGLWIDWLDCETVETLSAPAPQALTICAGPRPRVNPALQYHCPHCETLIMTRHYVRVIEDVLVDECPSCGGIWVPADELEEIREQFHHGVPADFPDAADAADTEGDAGQLQRDRRLRLICRFLCGAHEPVAGETPVVPSGDVPH